MENIVSYRAKSYIDAYWIKDLITKEWGSSIIVSRGKQHNVLELPGIVAEINGEQTGLLTYAIGEDKYEIVTLNSLMEGKGIGTGLLNEIKKIAKEAGVKSIWMTTTNDNRHALDFYQKRGFSVVAVHKNAVDDSRKIKPEIPLVGENGIPIQDEIELEAFI